MVNAQEAERRRIERNIHDGVQQEIVALIAGLPRPAGPGRMPVDRVVRAAPQPGDAQL
ncbi:histidine kinase [Streptosporangium sandarakinum]